MLLEGKFSWKYVLTGCSSANTVVEYIGRTEEMMSNFQQPYSTVHGPFRVPNLANALLS
jgi:hypothetical protein